jgi:uncharacterized protein (UPF0335 family)
MEEIQRLLTERQLADKEGFDTFKELKKNAFEIRCLQETLKIIKAEREKRAKEINDAFDRISKSFES